jgi:hypothetical protein
VDDAAILAASMRRAGVRFSMATRQGKAANAATVSHAPDHSPAISRASPPIAAATRTSSVNADAQAQAGLFDDLIELSA